MLPLIGTIFDWLVLQPSRLIELIAPIQNAIFTYLLDPSIWFTSAQSLGYYVLDVASHFAPSPLGDTIADMATWLGSIPVQKGFSVGLWLLSPFVSPDMLGACMIAIVYTWVLFALPMRCLLYVKGHIWSDAN